METTITQPATAPFASTSFSFRSALRRVVATGDDRAALVARVALGLILFPHGAQHALGWFGGYGFSGTFGWMTGTLGFPAPLAALAIIVELVAPLALLAGVGGRLAAAGLAGVMAGAITTHLPSGFFMNWFGRLPAGSEGFEYHLLVVALAVVVMIKGSGALSVDRRVAAAVEPAARARAASGNA
jgi:putative oxidoreductase